MSIYRKLELVAGLGAGLLGIVILVYPSGGPPPEVVKPADEYFKFLVWVCPEVLVALGAYFHAVRGIRWGRVLLLVAGIIPAVFTALILPSFGQLYYLIGGTAFLLLATGVLVMATMILSLFRDAS